MAKTAIIVGAGPAGLTAAYELLQRTDIKPVILEKSDYIGGLSRTYNYKGNHLDIGPHRFFSKSDRVMDWWFSMMPLEKQADGKPVEISYHNKKIMVEGGADDPSRDEVDNCLMTLDRQTRIYYLRKFFDYPISLKLQTFTNLGLSRTINIGFSYLKAAAFPIKPETNLEQFITNRFGRQLYLTFFKDYTEKVWGISCSKISAAWGAQRIKGLSIMKVLVHAFKQFLGPKGDIRQKGTETSLVEQFLYPKKGTGSMWQEVARKIRERGGEIVMDTEVEKLVVQGNQIVALETKNNKTGETKRYDADYVVSSMPVRELVDKFDCDVPPDIKAISDGLVYRDFICVGMLVNKLKVTDDPKTQALIADNWIYVQENDVLVGRLQIYNNWGECMIADPTKVWLGLEYFCNETDEIWSWDDERLKQLGVQELDKIGIIDKADYLDATVVRMPKTYPGYFGTYDRFDELSKWIDKHENLFLVGRNGMHKYNNQDHSMLTAMVAVDNMAAGIKTKDNLWAVNTEMEYHEEKSQT